MTLRELVDSGLFQVVNRGEELDRTVDRVFCCDLLSVAMCNAPAGCAWVTVMGNINTLAVVALTDGGRRPAGSPRRSAGRPAGHHRPGHRPAGF